MTNQQLDIMLKFITIGIMAIVLLLFISLWLAKHGVIPQIDLLQQVDARHKCLPSFDSTQAHFDRINQTFTINISHAGYCMST